MFSRRFQTLSLFVLTTVILLILAAALPEARFLAGVGLPEEWLRRLPFEPLEMTLSLRWLDALWITWWLAAGIAIAYSAASPETRKKLLRMGLWTVLAVLLGLLVYGRQQPPLEDLVQEEEESAGEPVPFTNVEALQLEAQPAPPEPDEVSPSASLGMLISIVALTAAGLLVYRWWRLREQRKDDQPWLAELQRRALLTLSELRQGAALDDAIVRCYREMGLIVEQQRGVRRRREMTAREFEAELARSGLPPRAVQRLTRLFEQVRYGAYRPTPRDQMEAIDSLETIVDACARLTEGRERALEKAA